MGNLDIGLIVLDINQLEEEEARLDQLLSSAKSEGEKIYLFKQINQNIKNQLDFYK